jgi:hypothetical protein
MSKISARREHAKATIDLAIRKALASCERKPARAFADFLWKVQCRSDLLRPCRYVGRNDARRLDLLVNGLLALFQHRKGWLRTIEEWQPSASTPLSLFSSLAHHLVANFPVPPVLLSVWFEGTGWEAQRRQRWFHHAGMGKSLRTIGFPIKLSKRMAHEFAGAPAQFSIEFALRWSQVRGLGGTDELAYAIASTRLGNDFDNDDFWITVIHLFINTHRINLGQVGGIVDYLNDQKFEPERVIIGEETEINLDPLQPELTIKGRTVASLMRRVEEWRALRRPTNPQRRYFHWGRSNLGEYRREGEDGLAWTIRELLDSDELAAEGKAMQHCVALYADSCAKRNSTIWSLGSEAAGGRQRVLTVEVDPKTKRVVQASMKRNEDPDEPCKSILNEWAIQEGLKVEL